MLLEVIIGKDIYVIGGTTQDGPFKGPGKTLEVTMNSTKQLRVREPNRIQRHNICIVGFLSFERLRWIFTIARHSTRTWGAWGIFQWEKTFSFFSDFFIQQVPADFRAIDVQYTYNPEKQSHIYAIRNFQRNQRDINSMSGGWYWVEKASMQEERSRHSCVAHQGKLWVIGGYNGES